MTIVEMMEKKREYGYSNEKLAELSGVPLGTVQKIFSGETKAPRHETIRKLTKVLSLRDDRAYDYVDFNRKMDQLYPHTVHESGALEFDNFEYILGKKQGEFTVEDYEKLPDNIRAELIDGYLYYMATPRKVHQAIIARLHYLFAHYIEMSGMKCMPFLSPVDVQLDCDDKTMLQPDIIIQCHYDGDHDRIFFGAPDFVVEVLSESTRKRDLMIKVNKYMLAGVREFWIVDPKHLSVTVYDFEGDNYPLQYTFEDGVPVNLTGGDLSIDFSDVLEYIKPFIDLQE